MNNQWNDWNTQPPEPKQEEFLIPLEVKQILEKNNFPVDRDGVLMLWQKAKADIEHVKAFELEIRKIAVAITFEKPHEGTNTVELGETHEAKATIKYNYKLADNDTVEACLAEIEKFGNEGPFIADRLVGWTPSFKLTEYRLIEEGVAKGDERSIKLMSVINKMLTITDAAPTLEIREKKVKKK
jgi:hypothetical protein